MELLGLLVVIIVIGALLGGNSLGETIRGGCGCLMWGIVALVVGVALLAMG